MVRNGSKGERGMDAVDAIVSEIVHQNRRLTKLERSRKNHNERWRGVYSRVECERDDAHERRIRLGMALVEIKSHPLCPDHFRDIAKRALERDA